MMKVVYGLAVLLIAGLVFGGCASKEVPPSQPMQMDEPAVSILLAPAESVTAGEAVQLRVIGFDASGKRTENVGDVAWMLDGLTGSIENRERESNRDWEVSPTELHRDQEVSPTGRGNRDQEVSPTASFTPDESAGGQAGIVSAQVEGMKATARVRVIPALPWTEDFEGITLEKIPTHWIGATGKFFVRENPTSSASNKVLVKTPVQRGLNRSNVYLGPPTMKDYTIQVDLMGTKTKRRLPDMGLIANRYTLDMQGRHQRLQIRSWASDLRMAKTIDFPWEIDVWYTMKMQVEVVDDTAIIRGKVWRTGEPEPEDWTLVAEDPRPNREGSPGIYGYSPTEIYYDNLKVW